MMMEDFLPERIAGIGEFKGGETTKAGGKTWVTPVGQVFLVMNAKTLEVRTERKLAKLLVEKYESVMVSRYFGVGGIEIVPVGQLSEVEIEDLVRLSYNLTANLG